MARSRYGITGASCICHHTKPLRRFSSSHPIAVFHTSPTHPYPSSPSFISDLSTRHLRSVRSNSDSPLPDVDPDTYPLLVDPVTGNIREGSSTSGREAARVVKFSPEGSNRDLMVFSEVRWNYTFYEKRSTEIGRL